MASQEIGRVPVTPPETPVDPPALPPLAAWMLILGLGCGIWVGGEFLGWRPSTVSPAGWRLLAIFLPTILALMLRPIPGGAAVLLGLVAAVVVGAITMRQALDGYADPTVWLVLAAYFISRALIKTGLARRIALTFIRLLGRNTLGLSYALAASDTMLAGMIPSNAARVGGVLLPITRSLAELYHSFPGKTAGLLGTFLMAALYQGDVVACSLFITGQASNILAASQADKITQGDLVLHYGNWFLYALPPALVSLLVVPLLVCRWTRPEIRHTPEAAALAREELRRAGPPSRSEWLVILVFAGVCVSWVVIGMLEGPGHTALIALGGVAVLLLSGVLTWEDCVRERGAWDVFIWYGGLVQLGNLLNQAGLTSWFAQSTAQLLEGLPLVLLFLALLWIYFYAHYGFASITTHILSMYPAFVAVLIALGAPPAMTAASFAFFANLSAGLTHYGTTPAPIIFSAGYVAAGTWWRLGLLLSLVHMAIWLTLGMAWWKLMGLW